MDAASQNREEVSVTIPGMVLSQYVVVVYSQVHFVAEIVRNDFFLDKYILTYISGENKGVDSPCFFDCFWHDLEKWTVVNMCYQCF